MPAKLQADAAPQLTLLCCLEAFIASITVRIINHSLGEHRGKSVNRVRVSIHSVYLAASTVFVLLL
jgi:hypothetical protein